MAKIPTTTLSKTFKMKSVQCVDGMKLLVIGIEKYQHLVTQKRMLLSSVLIIIGWYIINKFVRVFVLLSGEG